MAPRSWANKNGIDMGGNSSCELPSYPKPAGKTLRIVAWNCRSALKDSALWEYLLQVDPDVALLQDVRSYPPVLAETYTIRAEFARHKKGHHQGFKTILLAKGHIEPLDVAVGIDWIDKELEYFSGNLIAGRVMFPELGNLNILSVYSPAWHVPNERLKDIDTSSVRQSKNKDIWLADLVLAMLRTKFSSSDESWIVGGDFNNCETFSKDAKEYLGKMSQLGLKECLRTFQGGITPTFRHQRGIIRNQLDHLFVTKTLGETLLSAQTPQVSIIFESGLSDHSPIIADFEIRPSRRIPLHRTCK
jgi:exonuclease III